MEIKDKIKLISEHYGYDAQSRQCIEECGELIQAINKFWRKQLDCGKKEFEISPTLCGDALVMSEEYDNLVEELADVKICIEQLEYLLKIELTPIIEQKLNRQLERIKAKNDI